MAVLAAFGEPTGQGWTQIAELAIAFGLSAAIGLEREAKQKAAGLRTYTLVGTAAALFTLISKYGFTDVLGPHAVLDPSRVAAQIVSGVGFIGGGIIFVYRDSVRGLTTAASVWLTAAVGAAAGAGLPVLAAITTAAYFLAIVALPPVARQVTQRYAGSVPRLKIDYYDGRGLLRRILATVTDTGFHVTGVETGVDSSPNNPSVVGVTIRLSGRRHVDSLVAQLSLIDGVVAVELVDGEQPY